MPNWAIVHKTWLDSRSAIGGAALGTLAFVLLFVAAMTRMGTELLEFVGQFPFLKKIFEMGFGIRVGGEVSLSVLFAVSFTHLVPLVLAWGTIVAIVSRTTVGEIERGTADLLLTLPVSRREVAVSTTLVWVFAAALCALAPLIGVLIGGRIFAQNEALPVSGFAKASANSLALHLAAGGMATLISSVCDRRGTAIGVVAALALGSVTLQFVEPFLPALGRIRWVGLLNYFRPVDIVRTGHLPAASIVVLLLVAVLGWMIGTFIWCRKDIPAG